VGGPHRAICGVRPRDPDVPLRLLAGPFLVDEPDGGQAVMAIADCRGPDAAIHPPCPEVAIAVDLDRRLPGGSVDRGGRVVHG
jgi:hypothetical protein